MLQGESRWWSATGTTIRILIKALQNGILSPVFEKADLPPGFGRFLIFCQHSMEPAHSVGNGMRAAVSLCGYIDCRTALLMLVFRRKQSEVFRRKQKPRSTIGWPSCCFLSLNSLGLRRTIPCCAKIPAVNCQGVRRLRTPIQTRSRLYSGCMQVWAYKVLNEHGRYVCLSRERTILARLAVNVPDE